MSNDLEQRVAAAFIGGMIGGLAACCVQMVISFGLTQAQKRAAQQKYQNMMEKYQ